MSEDISPEAHASREKAAEASGALTPFSGYGVFLADLKARIQTAQTKATLAANRELIALYYDVGQRIVERQEEAQWGDGVLEQISRDLKAAFPDATGFSRRNLYDMRAFFLAYREAGDFVRQPVAQIPWGHNLALMRKVESAEERAWYASQTVEHGWSRAVLLAQIETGLYARQITAPKTTNFERTLPPPQSDLAQSVLKDPYVFGFLTLAEEAKERDLERGLIRTHPRLPAGVGRGVRVPREPVPPGGGRAGLLRGPAVLPPPAAVPRRHRPQNGRLRAGVRREDELLPLGTG